MYKKTLIYLISRKRNLTLAVKDRKINLLSTNMPFNNVTDKQFAPSFAKTTLWIFQLKVDC